MQRKYRAFFSLGTLLLLGAPSDARPDESAFLGKSLAKWTAELTNRDAGVRRSAAFALGKAGSISISAAPKLVDALKDSNAGVREAAAYALGEIGPNAWDETFPALVELLTKDSEPLVRRSAAFALGNLGRQGLAPGQSNTASVSQALEKALVDADASVRQNAAWALGRLGPKKAGTAVASLARALADADPTVRRDAAAALGEFGDAASSAVTPLLALFIEDKDPDIRKTALNALVNGVGPDQRATAAAPLRAALRDSDPEIVRPAALALANLGGPEAHAAVPVLCESLREKTASTRRLAAAALAHLGPDAAAAVASLTAALSDRDPIVRRNAALALGRVGPKAEAAVPALAKILDSHEPEEIRSFAAEALAHISPAILPAVPTLLRILKEEGNKAIQQRAVWALARLDDPEKAGIVPALSGIISETGTDARLVRYDSAIVLGILQGPNVSDQVIDVLQAIMDDKQIAIYRGADAKVSSGGNESREGQATVTQNTSGDCRGLAATALGRIGHRANRPAIIRSLKDAVGASDPKVRQAASEALRRIGG